MKGMTPDPASRPLPGQDALDAAIARVALVQQDPFDASVRLQEQETLMKGAYATLKAALYRFGMDAMAGSGERVFEARIPPEMLPDPAPDLELLVKSDPDGALVLRLQPRRA